MHPISYKGLLDPKAAEDWLKMMNYTFKALKCSDEDKVICGSFFMESDANIWWEALERECTAKGEPIT